MNQKIVIEPVTRVEGHGKVTIHLDENGRVADSFFHIVEFRGFEKFIQGHPYWEVPVLVQRLCGICPVSHHLAAAKAIDRLHGLEPEDLSPTTTKLRRLLHYGQIFQSHALHFFYLASPDLLFGADAPAAQRNVVAVIKANKALAQKGILMRKFGQEIIKAIAGKRIHGICATPGGAYKSLNTQERDYFLLGNDIPNIDTMIEWSLETIRFIQHYHNTHQHEVNTFASFPSGHLGLVSPSGQLELYNGRMRAIDAQGLITLPDIHETQYRNYFAEAIESWTYLKFPYLKHLGRQNGWNRVGPLARLNVADSIPTPLAQLEFELFRQASPWPNHHSMYYHWARLIEMLHCAEIMKDLLLDPEILGTDLQREGSRQAQGIGIIEAPRGTLIHYYEADEKGKVTKCNLIVSTTHNNEAMNKAVREVAIAELDRQPVITDGMLNKVEVAIRAYDPCLSCATHALGQMPLQVLLYNHDGQLLQEKIR
jgi:NAD-reducing hydrogenase large subunit